MSRRNAYEYLLGLQPGSVVVFENEPDASACLAAAFRDAVSAHPKGAFGVPTGATVEGMYRMAPILCEAAGVSCAGIQTFNMDCAMVAGPPGMLKPYTAHEFFDYPRFMGRLFHGLRDRCGFRLENAHFPIPVGPGAAVPFTEGALNRLSAYDEKIAAAGGLVILFGGLGKVDCHVAYFQPGIPRDRGSWITTLSDEVRQVYVEQSEGALTFAQTPTHGATIGPKPMLELSRLFVMAAFGRGKMDAVRRSVSLDTADESVPASLFVGPSALHRHGILIVDREAAAGIRDRKFVFEAEHSTWA